MASIINTIVTKFTAEGADQTAAAAENITKAQTRLGQTSASNGRQFAAQSQGLGGLVAAYAGAAATSFALQQAFAALQKAAQFDQIIQGTNTFSSQFGQSAESVIRDIKKITQGQLSIVEAATSANIALSAGFSTKQLNELADVATKSSRALGRDLQDSFQRLVRGSAKLEAELLDELGIFTRIEPAVEKYAAKINKSTTALSEFERRQAFVNAVIEEGQSKFSIIDTSTSTAAQSFSRLAANLTDLALTIGNVIANGLTPFVDYINNNLSAAFGAFGVITALILAKTNQLASEGLSNLTNKITQVSGALSTSFVGSGKATAEVLGTLANATESYNNKLGRGLGDQKARRDELINLAKAGTITVNQIRELNTIVEAQVKRDQQAVVAATAKRDALDKNSEAYKVQDKNVATLTASLAQNEKQVAANNKVLAEQSKLANIAAVATAGFGKAIGILGSAVGKALGFLNILLTVYSIINLIGPALLSAFGGAALDRLVEKFGDIAKNLLGLDKASKALDAGTKGFAANLTESALKTQDIKGNIEGFVKEKAFGIFNVEIKINAETIQRDVADAISAGLQAADTARSRGRMQVLGSALEFGPTVVENAPVISEEQLNTNAQRDYNKVIRERIELSKKALNNAVDVNTIKLLNVQIQALTESLNLEKEKLQIVGSISATTGISTKELFKFVDASKDGTVTMKTLGGTLQGQVYTLEQINSLSEERQKGARDLTNIQERILGQNFNLLSNFEKLSKAQLDLNGIGKARSDLLANEEKIQEEIKKLLDSRVPVDDARVTLLTDQLGLLIQQREQFNAQAATQEAVLRVQKSIRDTFGSQINALTNITGLTNSAGVLATDDLEIKRNQLSILREQASAADALVKPFLDQGLALSDAVGKLNDVDILIYQTGQAAKQALGGSIIEVVKEAVKLTQEFEKQALELDKQSKSTRLSIQREELTLQQQINDKQRELNTLIIQNQINAIQRQQRVNELSAERIDILRKGREEEAKSITSGVLGPLFTDQQKRLIEIRFKEEELNDLKRALGAQVASAKQTLDAEIRLARENAQRDDDRLAIQQKLNENDIASRTLDIDSKIAETKRQQEIFEKQAVAIQEQVKAFLEHPRELSKVLAQNIQDQLEIAKRINPDRAASLEAFGRTVEERQVGINDTIVRQIEDINSRLATSISATRTAQLDYLATLNAQKESLGVVARGQDELIKKEKAISDARVVDAVAAAQAKYNAVVAETGNRLLAAQQSLDILKREAERAGNSFVIISVKIAESITSNFEKGINSLVDAIANGTLTLENFKQGFKQFIVTILADITKAILNELITKPIKELVFGFTRDLISGLSGSTISDTLAKNISPAIAGQLTQSFADLPKAIAGFKELGVTPVAIVSAAPGVLCCGGDAAAAAAGGAGSTAAGAGSSVAQRGVGTPYDRPIGPQMPTAAGASAVTQASQPAVTRGVTAATTTFGNPPPPPQRPAELGGTVAQGTPANPTSVEVTNTEALGQSLTAPILSSAGTLGATGLNATGGATLGTLGQAAPAAALPGTSAFGTLGPNFTGTTGFASTTWGPFGMFGSNTLNPTGPTGFGAVGPMTGAGFNGTVTNGMGGFGPGYATQFGGTPVGPGNLGNISGGPGVTSFGAGAFEGASFKNTMRAADAGALGESQNIDVAGFQESLDKCESSVTDLAGGFEDFTSTVGLGDTKLAEFGTQSDVVSGTLGQQAIATDGVISGAIAQQATSTALQTADTVEAAGSQAVSTAAYGAAAALQAVAASGGGGGLLSAVAASGGLVGGTSSWARFAAGGGVMMRDRVPSLLEPGEFVMKKASVDSIGRGALERMNATGRSSGGATNIKVQVENQGNPKEAEQGETQMDGETAIVKLILKDLNSNGPIRRSIRGNM